MTNTKRTYKIMVRRIDGDNLNTTLGEVDGYVYNDIGLHKVPGQKVWTATHLPSGHKICSAPTRRECYITAREMFDKADNAILQQATYEFQQLIKNEKERIQNEQGK